MLGRGSIKCLWKECGSLTTDKSPNVRVYKSQTAEMPLPRKRSMWGKVKLVVMKFPVALQASPSMQAQRTSLRVL